MKRSLTMWAACFGAVFVFGLAGQARAAQISFTSVAGNWHDPVDNIQGSQNGDPVITNGVPTSNISWGVGSPQSGYDITLSNPSTQTLPPAPTPFFPIGTFTHQNFPINDPSLTSVMLDVVLVLNVDGTPTGPLTFTFTFNHVETPNNANPCAFPTPQGEGCTDRVTFVSAPQPTTFNVGGVDYTLAMSFVDNQGLPVSQFFTREGMVNTANLVGQFTLPPPPISCGDGTCNGTDTCSNCVQDCGPCAPLPVSQVQFDPTSYSLVEDAGLVTVTVTRTVVTSGVSTVQFASSNGTAVVGTDYVGVSGVLTFAAGETSKTFDLPVIDDRLTEGPETVVLNLTNATGAVLGIAQAVVTITDPNPPAQPAPNPFISQLVPNTAAVAFASSFPMRVLGTGFDTTNSQVIWNNGISMPVVSRTATEIVVTVNPSIWNNTAGNYPVLVRNPGADSNAVNFTVRSPGSGLPLPWVTSGPSANPNPTEGKTTNLTVRGDTFSCNGGQCGESLLTYTWMLSGTNPALNVTFTNNGTHAARDSVATFPGVGTYHIFARVKDTVTQFAVDSPILDVVVVQKATSLGLSPKYQMITSEQLVNLHATVLDQFGAIMSPPLNWTSTAGSLAANQSSAVLSVDTTVRTARITASLTDNSLSDFADIVVVYGSGGVGDISQAVPSPVPFKSNSGLPGVTFRRLNAGTRIRLFSTAGRLVQTLNSADGSDTLWPLTNASGDRVASGVYVYIIDWNGQTRKGKVVLIL